MEKCLLCRKERVFKFLKVCRNCIKENSKKAIALILKAHRKARQKLNLPPVPPREKGGVKCGICGHFCQIPEGETGYCGLSKNEGGILKRELGNEKIGLVSFYKDFHPTNCVASWICPGGSSSGWPKYSKTPGPEIGYFNASVFLGTCSYHCLYCQNTSWHQMIREKKPKVKAKELINWLLKEVKVSCLCWFGGSPEPQMPYLFKVSKEIYERARKEKRIFRICLETNGNFSWYWLSKIAEISLSSGGGIKFDLKAYSENLNFALSGVSNKPTFENFKKLASFHKKRKDPPFLRASTLLVPHYIDEKEIDKISKFIAKIDPSIPYTLLAFYPHYLMKDLGFTKREFALKAKEIAQRNGLKRVKIGNIHLLED